MVILLSRPWTRHNESLCNLSDLANAGLFLSISTRISTLHHYFYLAGLFTCLGVLLLATAADWRLCHCYRLSCSSWWSGRRFFNSKSVRGTAFRFNMMHNAEVLHDRCCVSRLARKYFTTSFALARYLTSLHTLPPSQATDYKTSRLLKHKLKLYLKKTLLDNLCMQTTDRI